MALNHSRTFAGAAALALSLATFTASAQKVPVIEKTLSNGMKFLLVPRPDEATVSGGWVAHVGSSNEKPGMTGIAHLFEHMMFKGTPTVGTKDAKRDLEIIAEQEKLRDQMRQEEALIRAAYRRGEIDDILKPENKTAKWKELNERFNKLVKEQRDLLVKNEFDQIYTAAGASGMNAFTSQDMTAYFITVPANKLELWMWMESERLMHPIFREFYAERDVVFEERRMRTESTPLGKFQEQFQAMFWDAHPYNWPIVGWPSDLVAISKPQADEFYAAGYSPRNVTGILVGRFDPEAATAMAERYFGRIVPSPGPLPDVVTMEVPMQAEKRMVAEAETNPQVDLLWRTGGFGHKDSYALEILARLLSGRTGRLYKGLVLGKEVATEAGADADIRKWAGAFNISAECKEGHTPEEVEQAIYAELEKLQKEPVPAVELQKVKNQFAAGEYRRLSSNMAILFQLIFAEGLGDWHEVNEGGPKAQAVTAADIQRVANTYFKKDNRAVAIYTRKPGTGSPDTDPEITALPSVQQNMVKGMIARLKSEKDVARLKQGLAKLEESSAQAPAEAKAVMDLMKKKMQARIAELEAAAK